MSQKQNDRYLFKIALEVFRDTVLPKRFHFLLIFAIFLAFQVGPRQTLFNVAAKPWFPVLPLGVAMFSVLAWRLWRNSVVRADFAKALQNANPERLLEVVGKSMKPFRALPDFDALNAQSRAVVYSLYGQSTPAMNTLAEVNWGQRPPMIQAVGLSAEGLVELLCRKDARRALELNRQARALASVSLGAAQTDRYYGTCVAVCEALLNIESPSNLQLLEDAAAEGKSPSLQLLASFGLAAAMEHTGNIERARQLRAFLKDAAPHCGPLQSKLNGLSASDEPPASSGQAREIEGPENTQENHLSTGTAKN